MLIDYKWQEIVDNITALLHFRHTIRFRKSNVENLRNFLDDRATTSTTNYMKSFHDKEKVCSLENFSCKLRNDEEEHGSILVECLHFSKVVNVNP